MKHRALVERDANLGTADPDGNPLAPNWQTLHASLACRAWLAGTGRSFERHVIDGGKTAAIEVRKVIVPPGTDIAPGDRIASVKDRLDVVIFTGPAKIEAAGVRADHIELSVEEVS